MILITLIIMTTDLNKFLFTSFIWHEIAKNCIIAEEEIQSFTNPGRPIKCASNLELLRIIIGILTSLSGVFSNLLVVIIIVRDWMVLSNYRKLIGGLAIVDLLFCITQVIELVPLFSSCAWTYGSFMCKFLSLSSCISSTLSIGFLLIIAIERYTGIVQPFSRGLSTKVLIRMLIFMFLFSSAISIPYFLSLNLTNGRCTAVWKNLHFKQAYFWMLLFAGHLIPLTVIAILYFKILSAVKRSSSSSLYDTKINNRQVKIRVSEQRRMTKIVFSLLMLFSILFTPLQIYWILESYEIIEATSLSILLSVTPYYLHLTVNPIIYSVLDVRFRSELKKIFGCS